MKTCLEHYEELPEPFRSEAIENHKNFALTRKVKKCETLAGAIATGFSWALSLEGGKYWYKFYKTIK
jgi:hypothetical protein